MRFLEVALKKDLTLLFYFVEAVVIPLNHEGLPISRDCPSFFDTPTLRIHYNQHITSSSDLLCTRTYNVHLSRSNLDRISQLPLCHHSYDFCLYCATLSLAFYQESPKSDSILLNSICRSRSFFL